MAGNDGAGELGADPQQAGLWPRVRRWLPLALILAASALVVAMGWHRAFSLEMMIAQRAALTWAVAEHFWLAILAYAGLYFAATALAVPGGSLFTVAGGFLFGVLGGTIITALAATAGAGAVFLVARLSLDERVIRRGGRRVAAMAEGFRRNAFTYLLALRLVPLFPFWLANVGPAVVGMRVLPYLAATLLGILPGTIAFAWVGAGLDSIIAAQEAANPGCALAGTCTIDPAKLVTGDLVAACIGLAVLALLPVLVQRWRGRRKPGAV